MFGVVYVVFEVRQVHILSIWTENARGQGGGERAEFLKFLKIFEGASNEWKWSRTSRKQVWEVVWSGFGALKWDLRADFDIRRFMIWVNGQMQPQKWELKM